MNFSSLTNLIATRVATHGLSFNIMFAGQCGSGKTTLINSLFDIDFGDVPDFDKSAKRVKLITKETYIEKQKLKIKLTIIETKGLGLQENKRTAHQPIVDYIHARNREYLMNDCVAGESRHDFASDNRVHCCIYMISPFELEPFDIMMMRELNEWVCLIPVIGNAHFLSKQQIRDHKDKIRQSIIKHDLKVYGFDKYDVPLAIIAGNEILDENGQNPKRYRNVSRTKVFIEEVHEFSKLKSLLFNEEILNLIETTNSKHCGKFRHEQNTQIGRKMRCQFDDHDDDTEKEMKRINERIKNLKNRALKQ